MANERMVACWVWEVTADGGAPVAVVAKTAEQAMERVRGYGVAYGAAIVEVNRRAGVVQVPAVLLETDGVRGV